MSTKSPKTATLMSLHDDEDKLNFSALVGNPPYSIEIGAGSALSIYPEFFELSWEIAEHASIVSPARWLTVTDLATARGRISIQERQLENEIVQLFTFDDANEVFPRISLPGGVSWWLRQKSAQTLTRFTWNGNDAGTRPLFSSDGLIQMDSRLSSLKEAISKRAAGSRNPVRGWKYLIERDFKRTYGGNVSTKAMVSKAVKDRPSPRATRIRFPHHGWLFFPEGTLSKEAQVPKGKFALVFTHASHETGISLNDRTMFLSEHESAKATMAIVVHSVEKLLRIYKFARTKLFRVLVESRLSSHSTHPGAYEDVPWIFDFDESDPIDWSQSVDDIDAQLVKFFGLEQWNELIQATKYPFANYFSQEFAEKLRSAGADISALHEWYGERLDETYNISHK